MNLYKNGYVVAEAKENDYTHNVWPLEDRAGDDMAARFTDEADRNWFLNYDMQHIVPDFSFASRYYQYCKEAGLRVNLLLYETFHSAITVADAELPAKFLGFDCIGSVYYSYLKNEYRYYKESLNSRGIYMNYYGLLNTLEDVFAYIGLRQEDINSGINLEDFWKETPVRISLIEPVRGKDEILFNKGNLRG